MVLTRDRGPCPLTRRELLLALGLAPLACRRPTPKIEARYVYPSLARAHSIRGRERPAPVEVRTTGVLILGGGVAGLSAGWWLRRTGHEDFRVLELEDRPGGTAAGHTLGGFGCPLGAHYLPAPRAENADLVALLVELGAVERFGADGEPIYAETQLCAAPEERVFFGGRWFDGLVPKVALSRDDERSFQRWRQIVERWASFRDREGRRAFTLPLDHSSPEIAELDRISLAALLDREGLGGRVFRWWVDYGCRDDFGASLADTSAWAGLHYFVARASAGEDDTAPFLTWPEGNGRLTAHLAKKIGGERFELGSLVLAVRPGPKPEVVALDSAGRPILWRADRVIFALPSMLRPYLFDAAPIYAPIYAPWLVSNLLLDEHPSSPDGPPAWDNVLFESRSLGYVVSTHQRLRERGPTVITHYYALSETDTARSRRALFELDAEDALGLVLADLATAHPEIAEITRRAEIARFGHGMVKPVPGSIFAPARALARQPEGGVHFAHSDLSGIALFEEAFHQGVRAAREVIG